MAVEEVRARLRRRLVELVGMEEADLLMDRPSGGWDELVTKEWLHLEIAVIDARFSAVDTRLDSMFEGLDHKFASLEYKLMGAMHQEFRDQTWKLMTAMLGAMGSLVAAMGIFVALVKL